MAMPSQPGNPSGGARSQPGEPAWEIALLFPEQGAWTEDDYLALSVNHPVEFSDGCLEVLPMPTYLHQAIVRFLFGVLERFVTAGAEGEVLFAPLPIRLRAGKYREPDIVYLRPQRVPKNPRSQPEGADLVIEVVSEGQENRDRDLLVKPKEYAAAGVSEYWIVDPEQRRIVVMTLKDGAYQLHGEFGSGQIADSVLLPGFTVLVDEVLAIGERGTSVP